jgi:ABC-type nitrate/sulfonate/bicarbonate transport system permease component
MKDFFVGILAGFLFAVSVFVVMIFNGLIMWLCYPAAVEILPILGTWFNAGTFKQWVLFSWFVASLIGCLRVFNGVKADNGGKK